MKNKDAGPNEPTSKQQSPAVVNSSDLHLVSTQPALPVALDRQTNFPNQTQLDQDRPTASMLPKMQQSLPTNMISNIENSNLPDLSESEWGKQLLLTDGNHDEAAESTIGFKEQQIPYRPMLHIAAGGLRTSQDEHSKADSNAGEEHPADVDMTPSKLAKFSNNIRKQTGDPEVETQVEEDIESPRRINQELELAREDSKAKNKIRSNNAAQSRQKTLSGVPNGQSNSNLNINRMIEKGILDAAEKNLEFYPAQSERSRMHAANTSQIQLTSGAHQPSETSTNNLLMYSQSIKLNDVESTIHNINNQSMMQSEFDPKLMDRLIAEESEKLLKNQGDLEKEQEIMRRLKELKINPGEQNSARLTEEQRRAMIAMQKDLNMLGLLQPLNNDDSINFSNLDSSIAPSQYNESTTNKGLRDKQYMKLQQQQQAIKTAQNQELQQAKKLKTNFSSQNAVTLSKQRQLIGPQADSTESRKPTKQNSKSPDKRKAAVVKASDQKKDLETSPEIEEIEENTKQQAEAQSKAKMKNSISKPRSDSPTKKHLLQNKLEVQNASPLEMTSFLSPANTDTFMTTQDNEILKSQQVPIVQNTASKPGSRDKNKDQNLNKATRDKKEGRKDQQSSIPTQNQQSNKKEPAANMLNFHKYSQITKQNQEKNVEKKEKVLLQEQREREREHQQQSQPLTKPQAAAEQPLEGIITLTDYFERMHVNKRLELPAQDGQNILQASGGGSGSAKRYTQKHNDEDNQFYDEFQSLEQIPSNTKKNKEEGNIAEESGEGIKSSVMEQPINKQGKYKMKEQQQEQNKKMSDQGQRNDALAQDGGMQTNPTFKNMNVQAFSPKQFPTSEARLHENVQGSNEVANTFKNQFAQGSLPFGEAKQKKSSKKSGSQHQDEISSARRGEQATEVELMRIQNEESRQYYQEPGQESGENSVISWHSVQNARKDSKPKNRPYSQGNAQMNAGASFDNRGEQLRQLLSQQKARRETNITNVQNQYNQYNQYILTNTDYKQNGPARTSGNILLLNDAPLETRSYVNDDHLPVSHLLQPGFQEYNQSNQMQTQQQFYKNQFELAGQQVFAHYDDDANFIQNDDGSQSANMMMLDGEIDQQMQNNQKMNRSIGSSQNHRHARMPPLGANRGTKSSVYKNDQSQNNSQSEAQIGQALRINSREFVLTQQRQLQMQQLYSQTPQAAGWARNQEQYQQALIGLQLRKQQSVASARSHLSREQQAEFLKRQSKAQQRQSNIPVDGTSSSAQRFSRVKEEMLILKKQRDSEQQRAMEDTQALAKLTRTEEVKMLSKSERISVRLPVSVLLRIVQHLTLAETSRFQLLCKYVRRTIIYQPEFEGQWVIKSFHGLLSKSGYSGLRNSKLRRIDLHQRSMHFQAQSLVRDSHDEQWHVFGVWANFAFVLTFIILPILLIVNEQHELALSPRIIFIPTTIAWVLLMLALVIIFKKINRYHKVVATLHLTQRQYQGGFSAGTPKGRNTTHCTKYEKSQFTVRFLISLIWALLSTYFGFFLKIYVLDWLKELAPSEQVSRFEFKWIYASAVSFGPAFLMYSFELLKEAISSQRNLVAKKEMLLNCITLSINKTLSDQDILKEFNQSLPPSIRPKVAEAQNSGIDINNSHMVHSKQMVGGPFKGMNSSRDNSAKELLPARQEEALDQAAQQVAIQKKVAELRNKKAVMLLKNHKGAVALIDFVGIFLNMAFLPIAIYAFLSFAAQRLDGNNEASYFLLMLPAWVASLPLFGYVILNGLAARNTRINKCEKLALSILVPFGSLITLILLICYIEGLLSSTTAEGKPAKWLLVLFIPHLLSLLCLYLYLRCLVRPVKVHALPAKSAAKPQKK